MLLREAQVLLRLHSGQLIPKSVDLAQSGNRASFENREAVRRALDGLSDVPSLAAEVQSIRRMPIFDSDSSLISQTEWNSLHSRLTTLWGRARSIASFLDATLGEPPAVYLTVTLPNEGTSDAPEGSSLDGAYKALNSLYVAFDQPTRRMGHTPLKITLLQPGSHAVELALEAVTAASVAGIIGFVVKSATDLLKLLQERETTVQAKEQTKQQIEATKQAQEATKQAREKTDQAALETEQVRLNVEMQALDREAKRIDLKLKELNLREETKKIEIDDLGHKHNDPELSVTLQAAITQYMRLHRGGTRPRLQLNAPAPVADAFPPDALPNRHGVPPMQLPMAEPRLLPEKSK